MFWDRSGGGYPAANFSFDPYHCQQVAQWTRGGEGQRLCRLYTYTVYVCVYGCIRDLFLCCLHSGSVCSFRKITEDPHA